MMYEMINLMDKKYMYKIKENTKIRVLVLCQTNSSRSQMAEAFLKTIGKDKFEVYSAGAKATSVHPLAIKVMKEIGIDISNQKSKLVQNYKGKTFDYVITLCTGDPDGACPVFSGNAEVRMYMSFEDPARVKGTDEVVLKAFRKVRDEIKTTIEDLIDQILKNEEREQ
ncbi:MAG: arsenate reductase ArsC [Candidatus Hodarchaeota archaeon]